jgi:proline dehydrogenase
MNFDHTEIAFAYKSDTDLKKAHFLFSLIRFKRLTGLATRLIPWFLKWNFPVRNILRKTLFTQFTGGDSLTQAKVPARHLYSFQVQTILDYSVEGGIHSEEQKDFNTEQLVDAVEFASGKPMVFSISVKVSGLASAEILKKLSSVMRQQSGRLHDRYKLALMSLSEPDLKEWKMVEKRLHRITSIASLHQVKVLVDAEESWLQDAIDGLITELMPYYNHGFAVIYHTIQLYRHDRLEFLKSIHADTRSAKMVLGVKLVRGAYMEKERKRADEDGYPSPIHKDKHATDHDFDEAMRYCLNNCQDIETVLATHNEESCLKAVKELRENDANNKGAIFHFSQLFGMSDHITFTLAKEGFSVSKYLPFGPLDQVVPYLMRRAQENSSVQGQSSRELALIRKEMKRRGL